jgi:hypothetical protein
MEGAAELLATHHGEGSEVAVGVVPQNRELTPYWGRFKLLDQRRREAKSLSLLAVLRYSDTAHRQVEPYAWTWAAAHLFASSPEMRPTFIAMAREGNESGPDFTRDFVAKLGDQWPVAQTRWRILIDEFDYGYDLQRNQVELAVDAPRWDGSDLRLDVQASRGWQSVGYWIPAGTKVQVSAGGRVTLGQTPRPWVSEPTGVTIRYHRGKPLGTLLATVVPRTPDSRAVQVEPLEVVAIGTAGELHCVEDSWMLFRVGDDPAELADNQGSYQVTVGVKPR